MCQEWVARLRRWDRHQVLDFVPFQDPTVPARFPWIPQDAFTDALQVVAPSGETWEGAGAAEKLTSILPGGRPLSWLFRLPLARPVADRAYRWVADNRSTSCEVHGGPEGGGTSG